MSIWKKKSLALLLAEASESEKGLKRTLTAWSLVALGIGAIIGAGLFVRTATAAAQNAGPSVTIAFIVAAIGCALAGLCYAELSSSIPISGSAYTYTYATMGEFMAWIIGWDLVLEYAVGAATVGISWSRYLIRFLDGFGVQLPVEVTAGPWDGGIINLPAVFIIVLMSLLLIKGTKESAFVNSIIVAVKISVVLIFIILGWQYINNDNYNPYIPDNTGNFGDFGFSGIIRAAAIVFFAYIGFDAVSTAAQEAKNPKRDMPIGILGSLAICTILYVLFSHVLSGVATVEDFRTAGKEASVAFAISKYMTGYQWLANFVTVAILAGFSSVILVMLLGQSRVFYTMSIDGLVPKIFSDLHPKYKTPYKSNMLFFVLTAIFGGFIPGDIVGEMTSIGTLFAFILVCAGVWIMRVQRPDVPRGFVVPALPVVAVLGIIVCGSMIYGLGW